MVEAVLTSTHNLCFGSKISKIGMSLKSPVLLCTCIKVGFTGVFFARTCFPDVELLQLHVESFSQ